MQEWKAISSCVVPLNESARLRALRKLEILDSKPDASIDQITKLAARIFQVPFSLVSVIDRDRQWIKSKIGVDVEQTSRDAAFCSHTIAQQSTMVVPDMWADQRFAGSPFVAGEPYIRFYAGAPIFTGRGHAIGALCVMDTKPRNPLSADEIAILEFLANMVSEAIHSHTSSSKLRNTPKLVQKRHALVAMTTMDGVWEWTHADNMVYFSPRCQHLLGFPESVVTAPPDYWLDRVHPGDMQSLRRMLVKQVRGEEHTFSVEHRVRHKNGTWRWVKAQGLVVRGSRGRCEKLIGSFVDVTALRTHDALTGLPNRSTFTDLLTDRLRETDFTGPTHLAVLMLDVNRFERLNDRFGTANADKILRDIAKRLSDAVSFMKPGLRATLARFEGDKFLVLMEGAKDADMAHTLGHRIQDAISAPFVCSEVPIRVSLSIGAALAFPHHRAHELIQNAQIALQESRKSGQGRCAVFTRKMLEENAMRCRLESELRDAIDQQELRAFYQPQFDLNTGELTGCEALVRWQHPQFGLLSPIMFLPLAEENGLISNIDLWMLETACEQMSRWRRLVKGAKDLRVSVNLSSHKFSELRLQHTIGNVLEQFSLPPSALCLEITETVLMRDVEIAVAILGALRRTGVGLHLDDFGAGYSSFAQLYELPFDTLKIDRSFLKNVLQDAKAQAIVESIIALGQRLDMSIIAEGVEKTEHSEFLKQLGCTQGQGYLYSPPVDAVEFEQKFIEPLRRFEPKTRLSTLRPADLPIACNF